MIRFLVAGVIALAATPSGTAWADHSPSPKNDDSTGCCVSFRDSPVLICAVKDACNFSTPPAGPK